MVFSRHLSFPSAYLISLSPRYCLLRVCCIGGRDDDGILTLFTPRALTLLSSMNIVAIKVKPDIPLETPCVLHF